MCWSTSDYNGMNRNCNGLSTSFDDDMAMQNISNIRTGNVYWPFLFGYCGLFFPAPGGPSFPAREWPFSPDPNIILMTWFSYPLCSGFIPKNNAENDDGYTANQSGTCYTIKQRNHPRHMQDTGCRST